MDQNRKHRKGSNFSKTLKKSVKGLYKKGETGENNLETLQEIKESAKMSMPGHAELQSMFKQALEDMAIPEAQHPKLLEQPDEKKWEIIVANNVFAQTHEAEEADSASQWIKKLKTRARNGKPTLSVAEARELHTALRTGHKSFLDRFVKLGGIEELNYVTRWYTDHIDQQKKLDIGVVGQIMSMYKVLLNVNSGMEASLNIPGTIVAITRCLDFDMEQSNEMLISIEVLELLSVVCWYGSRGREAVMEAIESFRVHRLEKKRFQTLVEYLERSKHLAFKSAIASFITTVCNSHDQIEDRIKVRNDLLALDIIKIFTNLLQNSNNYNNTMDKDLWTNINNQFQVFAGIYKRDHAEAVLKFMSGKLNEEDGHVEVDLSNISEVWNLLQMHHQTSGCQSSLLKLMQALLLIPNESIMAEPIFESITNYVYEATSFEITAEGGKKIPRKDLTEPPAINYSNLSKLYFEKLAVDAKLSQISSTDEIIEKMKEKIDELKTENDNLRKGTNGGAKDDGKGGISSGGEEIAIMKEREKRLLQEITELKREVAKAHKGKPYEDKTLDGGASLGNKNPPPMSPPKANDSATSAATKEKMNNYSGKLDSTGLVPAGPAPGARVIEPPPCPLPGTPGSLENAPVKVSSGKGVAVEKDQKEKGPSESELAIKKLGLKAKQKIKPNVKMTSLFWTVIPPEKLEGTIWPQLDDSKVKFDSEELEDLFGKKKTLTSKKSSMGTLKSGKVSLLDSNRKQNLGIALKKIRLKPNLIKAALLAVDDPTLTLDTTLVLIESAPTEDEINILKKYLAEGNDADKLGTQEVFLHEMSTIPNLNDRLQCIKTRFTLTDGLGRINRAVESVKKAIIELDNSKEVKKVLEIILAIGNYTNGSTPRGGAYGFKLELLPKLEQVRDKDNNTFMRYLYLLFEKSYPELCNFSLPACTDASGVSLKDFMADLNLIAANVQKIRTELERDPISTKDKFNAVMMPFEVKATAELNKTQEEFDKVRNDFIDLSLRFYDSGAKVEPSTFFTKFTQFEAALKRAGRRIMKERREEARTTRLNNKAKAQKLRRETMAKKRLEDQKDPNLIQSYKNAQKGTSDEVAERFIERWDRDGKKKKGRSRPKRERNAEAIAGARVEEDELTDQEESIQPTMSGKLARDKRKRSRQKQGKRRADAVEKSVEKRQRALKARANGSKNSGQNPSETSQNSTTKQRQQRPVGSQRSTSVGEHGQRRVGTNKSAGNTKRVGSSGQTGSKAGQRGQQMKKTQKGGSGNVPANAAKKHL